jgi:beta-glucosidase
MNRQNANFHPEGQSAGGELTVTVKVKNTSHVAGDEVSEFYLTPPESPTSPLRRLVGFSRLHLEPGEEKTAMFTLTRAEASTVLEDGASALLPGTYTLFCGGAQPQEAESSVTGVFEVKH